MRKFAIAGVAALAIAGSTAVYAQHNHWFHEHMGHMRMSPEDRAAFADARIAAVHAGLKLNADQEKLWPPVESAVRDFAKLRIDRANARMNAEAGGGCAEGSGDAPARARRQHGDVGGGAEEDRGRGRPALQDAGRWPEAPARYPDASRRPVRRRGRLAAPFRARHDAAATGTTATIVMAASLSPAPSSAQASARRNFANLQGKPPDSGGFFDIYGPRTGPGKPRWLAGHRGVALLNDALLRRLSGPVPGA